MLTIATSTNPLNELPPLFHCLDNHGLFTQFFQIKTSKSNETIEIINNLLVEKNFIFEDKLISILSEQMEGFVFKDIERFIDKIVFTSWSKSSESNQNERKTICLDDVKDVLHSYTSINMLETNFFKCNESLNWNLIGGLSDIKKALNESIVWPIKYENLYKELGMKQSSGVLLYGPSGCGLVNLKYLIKLSQLIYFILKYF